MNRVERTGGEIDGGVPLEKRQRLYLMTQRALIGFLSDRIMGRELNRQTDIEGQGVFDEQSDVKKHAGTNLILRQRCEFLAGSLVRDAYQRWFDDQIGAITEERFIVLYHGTHGPMNLFHALFPGKTVDGFLNESITYTQNDPVMAIVQPLALRVDEVVDGVAKIAA